MINPNKPFILIADCEVKYKGRAKSTSGLGRRVILHKQDGTLLIHRNKLVTPLNYNGPKSILTVYDNILKSTSPNNEEIIIIINKIIKYIEIPDWSGDPINISGTEKQLCEYIIANAKNLLNIDISETHREYPTALGNADLLFINDKSYKYLVEVKRGKANLTAVYQLHRYVSTTPNSIGYLAAPQIGKNALKELKRLGYKYLKVPNPIP